jgi:hypothetical protein
MTTQKTLFILTLVLLHQLNSCIFCDNENQAKSNDCSRNENESLSLNLKHCRRYESGYTFPCDCSTGMVHVREEDGLPRLLVFNQCNFGRKNGALNGIDRVEINTKERGEMGLAVYSAQRDICGGKEKKCFCTCFDQDAVEGSVAFKTSISIVDSHNVLKESSTGGYITDCLGLCGPHCEQGGNDNSGYRYASILIHDICQSFIRSDEPMPNTNVCSDEGWRALPAALLSLLTNGYCPTTLKSSFIKKNNLVLD